MERKNKCLGCMGWGIFFFFLTMALGTSAGSQEKFPTRPVNMIVPAAPGGGTDIMARILADATEPYLGQKIVVVNKVGGSGTIGVDAIFQAKPDGYTLGCVWNAPITMVPHVLRVNYNLDRFSYVSMVAKGAVIFCVRSEFPAKTAEEFFEYVRNHPGKLTYANDGVGNLIQFAGERMFHALKLKLRPVPYGGAGESIKALLGGHVDVYGGSVPPAMPHIKSGAVRAVFVTTRERIEELPDVVCASDLKHPEAATPIWRGVLGPEKIAADRLAIFEKAFRQGAQTQKVKDHLFKLGETVVASTGKEFEDYAKTEAAAMAAVAKEIGLAPK